MALTSWPSEAERRFHSLARRVGGVSKGAAIPLWHPAHKPTLGGPRISGPETDPPNFGSRVSCLEARLVLARAGSIFGPIRQVEKEPYPIRGADLRLGKA